MDENEIGECVISAAIHVHRALGPGLLESVYELVLEYELKKRGITVQRQVPISIHYDAITIDEGFRADLIVNDRVIVELKSVTELNASHRKQIQTYLRLTKLRLGYLLNFGAPRLCEGIVRAVNGLPDDA